MARKKEERIEAITCSKDSVIITDDAVYNV